MAPLKLWCFRFVLLFSLAVFAYFSLLLWQEDILYQELERSNIELASIKDLDLASASSFAVKPLRLMLKSEAQNSRVEPMLMTALADRYILKKPLDVDGWLWKSLFHHRAGEIEASKSALSYAHRLSKRNMPSLSLVFNRYLELGAMQEAMDVAGDLSAAQPKRFRSIFYLMSRLQSDYKDLIARVIPRNSSELSNSNEAYTVEYYYKVAMADAIRAKNSDLAAAIWQAAPIAIREHSWFGNDYVEYLAYSQNDVVLSRAWKEHTRAELNVGIMPQQQFLEPSSEKASACWNLIALKGESFKHHLISYKDEMGLKVEFLGSSNFDYHHARCLFIVESGRQYRVRGYWRGDNITTLSGPFFDVIAPSVSGVYFRSEPKIGSWPWSQFEFGFKAPENVSVMTMRLRRVPTSFLDSKISGEISFSGIELVLVEEQNFTSQPTLKNRATLSVIE